MPTKLDELIAAEQQHFDATSEHLGTTIKLVGDLESLYEALTPLIKRPRGDVDGDENWAVVSVLHELMMCKVLLVKAVLAALRMYHAESIVHVRRAIEACAFSVRMSKHHELARIWAGAGADKDGQETKYNAYRRAFETKDVYPKQSHPDYDPLLTELKGRSERCSKMIHGSVIGMAGHVAMAPKKGEMTHTLSFFDMPPNALIPTFVSIIQTHILILQLFGKVLEPYCTGMEAWKTELAFVIGRFLRHSQKWEPSIKAQRRAPSREQRQR
jgi:hypothetical protein